MKRLTRRVKPAGIKALRLADPHGRGNILYVGKHSPWRKDPAGALPGHLSRFAVRLILQRLAEYEDSGFSSLEVQKIAESCPNILERLSLLDKCRETGMRMTLPCRIGDTVHDARRMQIVQIMAIEITGGGVQIVANTGDVYKPEDFGKTVHVVTLCEEGRK